MRHTVRAIFGVFLTAFLAGSIHAEDKKPAPLSEKQIAEGWISLFDGETTFGWVVSGDVTVKNGAIQIAAGKPAKLMPKLWLGSPFEILIEFQGPLDLHYGTTEASFYANNEVGAKIFKSYIHTPQLPGSLNKTTSSAGGTMNHLVEPRKELAKNLAVIETTGKAAVAIRTLRIRPLQLPPLFNGKDLSGWKLFKGDPKRELSTFDVTKDGELHVANGPGDLQTEKTFADFVLQFECKTNGKGLNSGIFFRCIANEYQNGYEAQIQNLYLNEDRTKPVDSGTGAIYRRIPARKVVSNDNEWFTLTVVANKDHFSTWVNGYQTVDWTDDRKPDDNPRKGLRTGAGHLSIQGHDKTTDILFRNIRVLEMKSPEKP